MRVGELARLVGQPGTLPAVAAEVEELAVPPIVRAAERDRMMWSMAVLARLAAMTSPHQVQAPDCSQ